MAQDEQTPKKILSKAERAARRKARATRATAKAAKITSKSTKQQKADAPKVTAIVSKAEQDRANRQRAHETEEYLLSKVNWQWRKFALGIMNGLQNYKAYAEAYDMNDVDRNDRSYKVAAVLSSQLLKNPNFRAYWRELLEEQGFSNDMADTEMVKLMTDPDTPAAVRRATIRDYNELQGRIVKKQSWTDEQGISLFDPENTSFEIRVVRPEAKK